MKVSKSDRIRRMYDQIAMATLRYHNEFRKAYPVGTYVSWIKNSACPPQIGRVVRHAYGDSLYAENGRTGKTVCITHYDIHCAAQRPSANGFAHSAPLKDSP